MLIPNVLLSDEITSQQSVCLLGATGSIGESTLKVIKSFPQFFSLVAVSADRNVAKLKEVIDSFAPQVAVLSGVAQSELGSRYKNTTILYGSAHLESIAQDEASTTVVSAIVGVAALPPTVAALKAGKKIVLANKESIICGASFFDKIIKESKASIIPADSEHCSIFQSLVGKSRDEISSLLLTASGGAFRNRKRSELRAITPAEAVNHPNWSMGQKISIDSATMVNKALEYMEAHFLFGGIPIEVVIHPQSIVHGGVSLTDGSLLLHASVTDMQAPLAYALSYPARLSNVVPRLTLPSMASSLTFEPIDFERFPAVKMAKQAVLSGASGLPCVFNSANEKAVELFIKGAIRFDEIEHCIEEALGHFSSAAVTFVDDVMLLDSEVKGWVQSRKDKRQST